MDFKTAVASEILTAMNTAFEGAELPEIGTVAGALEVPPDTALGDYAFPCFKLSKSLRKSPIMIADALAGAIHADFLGKVESVKGYLNFFIDKATYAEKVLSLALEQGEAYGADNSGAGKTVVLDYSSINIAKRFHIGHLSTTMIGNSLYRLHKFFGWRAVGVNHLGDWGTQFGKMIAAYKRWGDHDTVAQGGVDEMVKLYVRFNEEAKANEALNDEGRAWFKKIEDGDPEALEIFGWFKSVTLKDAERVYDLLGVKFDSYAGESFYNDKMEPVIQILRDKGLLKEDQGAQIVDLSDYGMPPALILRSDGATLYMTRDLAAAKYRKDTYNFDKSLYVVAYQQDLHFRQLFKVLELMGYDWAKDCEHVAFGMVSFEGGALSTRQGHVVYLDDLLHQAIDKARAIIVLRPVQQPHQGHRLHLGAGAELRRRDRPLRDVHSRPGLQRAAQGGKRERRAGLRRPHRSVQPGRGAADRAVPGHPEIRREPLRAQHGHPLRGGPGPGLQQVLL